MPPSVVPDEPSGSWGYSRLTFTRSGDEIIATLVEGPREGVVRCQRQDLPCSYLDLKELRDSGKPVPAELEITAEELNLLVEQLDSVRQALGDFTSADDACSAGYEARGSQAVNMGIHFVNGALVSDGVFDPTRPEILLFAKAACASGSSLSDQPPRSTASSNPWYVAKPHPHPHPHPDPDPHPSQEAGSGSGSGSDWGLSGCSEQDSRDDTPGPQCRRTSRPSRRRKSPRRSS